MMAKDIARNVATFDDHCMLGVFMPIREQMNGQLAAPDL
jgi:hypothetical protein